MKSEEEILSEIVGHNISKTESISAASALDAMRLFSAQFRKIKTTCGKEIIFDDIDYELLRERSLFIEKGTGQIQTVHVSGNGKKTSTPVAKIIMGADGKSIIHYGDGNKLNIKRNNLTVTTFQKAHFKNKLNKNNTTGFKGVHFNTRTGRYTAQIKKDNKAIHLGYFIDINQAALAYNEAAIKYFGTEYAKLNKIDATIPTRL